MQSTQSFFLEVFSVTLIWGVIFLVWWFLHKRSEERCNTESIKLDADDAYLIYTGTNAVGTMISDSGELSAKFVIKETLRDLLDQVKSLESVELQKILCAMLCDKFQSEYYQDIHGKLFLTCGSAGSDITKEFESFRESLYADSDNVKDEEI